VNSFISDELLVAFTIDTDGDSFFGNRFSYPKQNKTILGWKGLDIGKNLIADNIDEIAKSFGISIPLTWFIRCDCQIKSQYGDAGYLLDNYSHWWQLRMNAGDDLQWHAHLYRYKDREWIQETEPDALAADIEEGYDALNRYGLNPKLIRIGDAYQSNELMTTISNIGLQGDASAIPGRKRYDGEKSFDWSTSPNAPYRPSQIDYRVNRTPEHNFWEIPMNTIITEVSYDKSPILRYVNLAFQPGVIDKGLRSFVENYDVLVTVIHPFEIVPDFFLDSQVSKHPLVSFNQSSLKHNLKILIETINKTDRNFRFVTMSKLIEELNKRDAR
jgi:hypothetical protein